MQLITPLIIILVVAFFVYIAWCNSARQKGEMGNVCVCDIVKESTRITGRFLDLLKMADVIILNEIKTL